MIPPASVLLRAFGIASSALILAACSPSVAEPAPAQSAAAPRVTTAEVVPAAAVRRVRTQGALTRRGEARLAFKTGGVVDRVLVRPGDRVDAGALLAVLRLDELDAGVVQARELLEDALRAEARAVALSQASAGSIERAENAAAAVVRARAALSVAEFNRRFAEVRAPAPGVVVERLAEPAELVSAGQGILTFAPESEAWLIRCALAEGDVARVREGDAAWATDVLGRRVPARVIQIAGGVRAATGLTLVELEVEGAFPEWRSGFVMAVEIEGASGPGLVRVPAGALAGGVGDRTAVLVVDSGVARMRPARLVGFDGEDALIAEGPAAGGRVVASGVDRVRDGSPVLVHNP